MKQNLVVLSGAGISAESGLQTFRDSDGLWEGYNIQDVATPRAWRKNPQLVLDFYNMRRRALLKAKPNAAHVILAQLQQNFNVHIITQNVDDLHERAGSLKVMHLHGELLQMRSEINEHLVYPILTDIHLGDTAQDGAQLRPNIVWFEEAVPMIEHAIPIVQQAHIFVVVGTSLAVYPAAGLLNYVNNNAKKFVIDKKIPPLNNGHNVVCIQKPATQGMEELRHLLSVQTK